MFVSNSITHNQIIFNNYKIKDDNIKNDGSVPSSYKNSNITSPSLNNIDDNIIKNYNITSPLLNNNSNTATPILKTKLEDDNINMYNNLGYLLMDNNYPISILQPSIHPIQNDNQIGRMSSGNSSVSRTPSTNSTHYINVAGLGKRAKIFRMISPPVVGRSLTTPSIMTELYDPLVITEYQRNQFQNHDKRSESVDGSISQRSSRDTSTSVHGPRIQGPTIQQQSSSNLDGSRIDLGTSGTWTPCTASTRATPGVPYGKKNKYQGDVDGFSIDDTTTKASITSSTSLLPSSLNNGHRITTSGLSIGSTISLQPGTQSQSTIRDNLTHQPSQNYLNITTTEERTNTSCSLQPRSPSTELLSIPSIQPVSKKLFQKISRDVNINLNVPLKPPSRFLFIGTNSYRHTADDPFDELSESSIEKNYQKTDNMIKEFVDLEHNLLDPSLGLVDGEANLMLDVLADMFQEAVRESDWRRADYNASKGNFDKTDTELNDDQIAAVLSDPRFISMATEVDLDDTIVMDNDCVTPLCPLWCNSCEKTELKKNKH